MEEIKVNLENLTGEERQKLMALIEKANAPKSWTPKLGEKYYYFDNKGTIFDSLYETVIDDMRYNLGNVFHTENEAIEERKSRQILTQWKRLAVESGENENPWDGKEHHWYCFFSYEDDEIDIDFRSTYKSENVYFATEDALINAINKIGEDNVKRYILGVTDE